MSVVRKFSSGGPYEAVIGYSRAVSFGPFALTAGCTSVVDGAVTHVGDPYSQARVAIANGLRALAQAGFRDVDVVQTRVYVTDGAHSDAIGRAHGEVFGTVRPVTTMVIVAGLIDPSMLVEVELVAYVP